MFTLSASVAGLLAIKRFQHIAEVGVFTEVVFVPSAAVVMSVYTSLC